MNKFEVEKDNYWRYHHPAARAGGADETYYRNNIAHIC